MGGKGNLLDGLKGFTGENKDSSRMERILTMSEWLQ